MNNWIEKNILKIIALFLILGPIFDLITSVSIQVFSFNFIILFKIFLMMIITYYAIFISKNKHKKKIWI